MKVDKYFLVCFILSLLPCLKTVARDISDSNTRKAEKYTADSLYRYIHNAFPSVAWLEEKDDEFIYSPRIEGENRYYLVNTRSWRKKELFKEKEVYAASDALLCLDEWRERPAFIRPEFKGKDRRFFTYHYCGKKLIYDLKKKTVKEVEKEETSAPPLYVKRDYHRKYSADSLYWISAVDDDIYLYFRGNGDSLRLTQDGQVYYSFATGGDRENHKKGIQCAQGSWIGDTHKYILVRTDKRKVDTISLVDNLSNPRPKTRTYKFPMPGDENVPQYEVFLIDADKREINRIAEMDKFPDQELLMSRMSRYRIVGKDAYILRANRGRSQIELCRLNGHNGSVDVLISEDVSPHLNEQLFDFHILSGGKEILWWSERSGKGRFYLYDEEGRLKNPVGGESSVAGNIVRIDTLKRKLYFAAYGGEKGINPNYRFYYSASLDGGEASLLTPGDGDHSIEFSPSRNYIVDTYSRMDMAPKHQICDLEGKVVFEMESADLASLFKTGWTYPELLALNAADSVTKLYGVVYLPFNIEKGRKYPVIANVYPGPQDDQIPLSFSLDDNYNHSLAQLGFIVLNFQFRGSSPKRGKAFYNYGYGRLRDYALDDLYALIMQIGDKYSFADMDRVGIYGHSGGGFMTVSAMLSRPDFYKVGIAASGNYDNNIYTQWWGESFQGGHWIEDSSGKERFECNIPTSMELAENLKGRLMLITGDMDNNVHPASTMRMADALIRAEKRFDMLVLPGVDHGVGDKYYINLIRSYFAEHLSALSKTELAPEGRTSDN